MYTAAASQAGQGSSSGEALLFLLPMDPRLPRCQVSATSVKGLQEELMLEARSTNLETRWGGQMLEMWWGGLPPTRWWLDVAGGADAGGAQCRLGDQVGGGRTCDRGQLHGS